MVKTDLQDTITANGGELRLLVCFFVLFERRTTSAAARNNQLVGPAKTAEKSFAAIFKKMVDAICRPAV
ncbi:hypothetical protein [Selenomonas ruminantium]|uniref:hypothetical protein n=1 Tax=Selenomonas ruminantium TaxID=971 RepID=UPI0026F0F2B8|nr:hypothetical protein [Selenomonas ruminantium]